MACETLRGIFLLFGLWVAVTSADDATTSSAVSGANCSSTQSMIQGMQQCLDTYNIPLIIPHVADEDADMSLFMTNLLKQIDETMLRTLCRDENRENYISASFCIYNVSMQCDPATSSVMETIAITPEVLRQQVEYQCQSLTSGFDLECVMSKTTAMQECIGNSSLFDLPATDEPTPADVIVCLSQAASRICASELLVDCGAVTLQTYFQQLPPFPENCLKYTGPVPGAQNETVDCNQQESVSQSYLQCQIEAGLFMLLPETARTHVEIVEFTLRTITAKQGPEVCSKLSQYVDLVNCTLSLQAYCTPDNEKQTLPDIDAVQAGLRNLCEHVADYNSNCITAALAALDDTEDQGVLSNPTAGCDARQESYQALLKAVSSCDEKTVSLYKETLTSQLPVQCRQSDVSTGYTPSLSVRLLISVILGVIIL